MLSCKLTRQIFELITLLESFGQSVVCIDEVIFFIQFPVFLQQIFSNHSSIKGVLRPATVTLKTTQATSCLLILTSNLEATPGIVTQVNVAATSVSRNAQDKKVLLLSLTVTVIGRGVSKTEYLQNERKLAVWHVVLISISTFVVILLVAVLLVVRLKRASWSPKKHTEHENDVKPGSASSHLLQLQKFDEEAVNDMA